MKRNVGFWVSMASLALVGSAAAEDAASSLGLEMVSIKPGRFVMGSDGSRDHWDERPAHSVNIKYPFRISAREVTVEQYRAFRPEYQPTPGFEPYAAGISWDEAQAFCEWLGRQDGRTYRLPTEAEWEYACRAGTETPYSSGAAAPAAETPNPWGLYNMHTGVREWCHDWYGAYPGGERVDPVGPADGLVRVVRGGSLDDSERLAERRIFDSSSSRAAMPPAFGPPREAGLSKQRKGGLGARVGLIGTWFGAEDLQRPQQRDVMTRIDNNWINDIARGRGWSARWRGLLEAPHTGTVHLRLLASTGARVTIDGELVLDQWEQAGETTATLELVSGRKYPIEITYARRGTLDTYLKLLWHWEGTQPEVIGERWLSHADEHRQLAIADGGAEPVNPGFHSIGFRIVEAPLPATASTRAVVPYVQAGVHQDREHVKQGPDPEQPYFRKRYLLPTPLDNATGVEIDAVAMHPSFRGHNHSPALEVCPNGDVLMVIYTSYREYEPGVSLIAARLRFGADEWDMPSPFVDLVTVNDHAPLLWTDPTDGTVSLFWGSPRLAGGFPFQWTTSSDNGATWSPVRFPQFTGEIGPHSRQPINTALLDRNGTFYLASDGDGGRSVLWATNDGRATWFDTVGRSVGRHTTYTLLGDGATILGLGGKNTDIDGFMPSVTSHDGGRNWVVARTPFPAQGTNQRPCVLRLRSGRIIFAADFQHFRGQKPEGISQSGSYVAFSDDDGRTWTIRELPGVQQHESPQWHNGAATLGYCALRQAPNGMIHLIATMNRPCLHFEFNEAWLDSEGDAVLPDADLMRSTATVIGSVQRMRETYPNGKPRLVYEAGVADDGRFLLHGDETWYYPDGSPQREAQYELGRKVGTETYRRPAGTLLWKRVFDKEGGFTWTQFHPDGSRRAESHWRDFHAEGPARRWDSNGRLVSELTFERGAGSGEAKRP